MQEALVTLLKVIVGITIPLAAFATGARATHPTWILRQPALLARSLFAILVVVPLVEALLAAFVAKTDVAVRAGVLVAILSVGVGPPALLRRTHAHAETASYEIGLNVALTLAAILYMPALVALHRAILHHGVSLPVSMTARVVLTQALLPLLLGIATARWLPRVARPVARHAPRVVPAAMGLVVVLALLVVWRPLLDLGVRPWLVCGAIAASAIAIGHLLGGPQPERRMVLAGFSAIRFPALAVLLLSLIPRGRALLPIVLAYFLTSALLVAVYSAFMATAHEEKT